MTNSIKIIKTARLSLKELPNPNADWHELSLFALSFDPRMELDNSGISEDLVLRKLKDTYNLKELRICLYNMQRWWNNKTVKIEDSALKDMRCAVELIRSKLDSK